MLIWYIMNRTGHLLHVDMELDRPRDTDQRYKSNVHNTYAFSSPSKSQWVLAAWTYGNHSRILYYICCVLTQVHRTPPLYSSFIKAPAPNIPTTVFTSHASVPPRRIHPSSTYYQPAYPGPQAEVSRDRIVNFMEQYRPDARLGKTMARLEVRLRSARRT